MAAGSSLTALFFKSQSIPIRYGDMSRHKRLSGEVRVRTFLNVAIELVDANSLKTSPLSSCMPLTRVERDGVDVYLRIIRRRAVLWHPRVTTSQTTRNTDWAGRAWHAWCLEAQELTMPLRVLGTE
jgi:hypothetical protein